MAKGIVAAADPAPVQSLSFDNLRTSSFEQNASTGPITQSSGNTGQATITLTAGKSYKFDSSYGYSYVKTVPSIKFSLINEKGTVIASSATPSSALQVKIATTGTYTLKLETTNATSKIANNSILKSFTMNVHEIKPALPATSGNTNIDALISGSWWHDVGAVAEKSTDAAQTITAGLTSLTASSAKHTVTYSYLDNAGYSWLSGTDKKGFGKLDDNQKAAVKKAFDYISSLINVTFSESSTVAGSDISFGMNDQTASAGYANYPHANGANPSVLMLDNSDNPGNSGANLGTIGSYGWETLVHEIGHTMGLKHPGNYNAGGGTTPGPYLPAATDNRRMALMSYTNPTDGYKITATSASANSYSVSASAVNPTTFGVYDIAALQYLYGANTNTTTSTPLLLTDSYQSIQTVWAPKGVAIDASATTRGNVFDLRGGAYSSVAVRGKADAIADLTAQLKASGRSDAAAADWANKIWAAKSQVANAAGAPVSTLNSSLYYTGKNDVGLAYGSTISSVKGGSGDDKFFAANYNSTLDGGGGTSDTVYLQGSAAQWQYEGGSALAAVGSTSPGSLSGSDVTLINKISNIKLTLKGVEKYQFYKASDSLLHTA
jgi:hypothetical protein